MGTTSLIIHVLTLLSLSITHEHEPTQPPVRDTLDPSRSHSGFWGHQRNLSHESTLSEVAARLNGVVMAQTQCLRVLANLCIDSDDNRVHLILHDTPLFVLKLVKDILASSPPDGFFDQSVLLLLKTAMGALLNLQLEHPDSRRWLLKLPKPRRNHHPHEHMGHLAHSHGHFRHLHGAEHNGHSAGYHHDLHHHLHHLHNPHPHPHATTSGEFIENSPFELPEPATIRILLEVATDPRIYAPATTLRCLVRPDDADSEEQFEVEGAAEKPSIGYPIQGDWDTIEMGAEVAAWAARIADDLLTFEAEEARAAREDDAQAPAGALPSFSKSALAADQRVWELLLRPLAYLTASPSTLGLRTSPPDGDVVEDASPFLDADMSIISLCGELLEGCAQIAHGNDHAAKAFKRTGLASLTPLLDFIEFGTSPLGTNTSPPPSVLDRYALEQPDVDSFATEIKRAKASAVQAVVAVVGEDRNMSTLFGDAGDSPFLQRMRSWLNVVCAKREDLVSCSLLSIANLARTDANCIALVQSHQLVPLLVSLLPGKKSMLLYHATLGLLKNLCIPVPNKALIGDTTIFELLPPFLSKDKDHAQPIQFAAVGIAKHLAYTPTESLHKNAIAICGIGSDKHNTLDSILDLISRTEDTPTRLEATRVLGNLIRNLWSSKTTADGVDASLVAEARARLTSTKVVAALCDMLRRGGKFPVLINEGLVGLTLLASGSPDQAPMIASALLGRPTSGADAAPSTDVVTSPTGDAPMSPDAAPSNGTEAGPGRAPPTRSSTADSMMSNYSSTTVTAPPDTAADILYDVLWRNDGRMPIQFAENGCSLLTSLVSPAASSAPSASSAPAGAPGGGKSAATEEVKDLSIKMLPALRGLKVRASGEQTQMVVNAALEACENAVH